MLEYDFVIYPRKLWVGSKQELANKFFNREQKEIVIEDNSDYEASVYNVCQKDSLNLGYFVLLDKRAPASIMGHEAIHVALELFREMDIEIDFDNQEPLAYLMGFVCKCIANYGIDNE